MIPGEQFEIPKGAKVRLKADRADVYNLAAAGSEGWVRRRRRDPVSDHPQVFIEWDRDHWAYNGERDIWTFENHFEAVEGEDMSAEENSEQQPSLEKRLEELLAEVRERGLPEDEPSQPEPALDQDDVETPEEYQEILKKCYEEAISAKAFVVISIHAEEVPGFKGEVLVPRIDGSTLSRTAALLLEVQVAQLAASVHQDAVQRLLELELKDDNKYRQLLDTGEVPGLHDLDEDEGE